MLMAVMVERGEIEAVIAEALNADIVKGREPGHRDETRIGIQEEIETEGDTMIGTEIAVEEIVIVRGTIDGMKTREGNGGDGVAGLMRM